jgi:hypothetical protein
LWVYLEVAGEEIRGLPVGEIFTRFIAWTR